MNREIEKRSGSPSLSLPSPWPPLEAREGEDLLAFALTAEALPFGFAYLRSLRDAQGAVVDLEVALQNAAAAALSLWRDEPQWSRFIEVAETGTTWRNEVESTAQNGDCVLRMSAVRVGRGVAVTFEDVTAHRESAAERASFVAEQRLAQKEACVAKEKVDIVFQQLRASEERFRVVQESSPDGFMMFRSVRDADGAIRDFEWIYTNLAANRIVGKSNAELAGKSLLTEMPGNKEEGLFDAYVRVVETGEPFRREFSYAHEGFNHAFRVLALRLDDGFAVTFEDVTERMRQESERAELLAGVEAARAEAERQREQAEAASHLKDEFLATVSHELRTPLQAVLGWALLLRDDPGLDPDRLAKGIHVIERNARAQARIIEDILDVSRIITGKLRLTPLSLNVATVVEAAADTLRAAADAKRITLTVEVGPEVGKVVGDPDRLQQVVWNLVSNAVKFTSDGGCVAVKVQRFATSVSLVVSDTGKGITAAFLPHVFERFRQADGSTTRPQGGLGLGLAIVRHLVELHGGRVFVRSDGEGSGATFEVSLPVRASVAHIEPMLQKTPQSGFLDAGPELGSIREKRVLIVDDEEDARELIAALLQRAGVHVKPVASAEEAMAALASFQPDLLVSDIGMPEEDGYSLLRRIRALASDNPSRGIPAIALTAYARAEDRRRALLAGFGVHMSKPVNPGLLIDSIARLLGPDNLSFGASDGVASQRD